MAKICKQCNLKYKDSATTCVNCRSELETVESSFKAKWILIYSALAVALVTFAVTSFIYLTGPRAAVKGLLRAYSNNNVSAVVDCFPNFLVNAMGEDRESVEANISKSVNDVFEYITFYNVESVKNPTSNKRNKILESLDEFKEFGYDESKLEDIKIVWTGVRGGPVGTWNFTDERFIMIKYDGSWYWWPM